MLLTNKYHNAILQLQLRKGTRLTTFGEVLNMIYEILNELEEKNENYGISPLEYVVLECGK